jgi:hypothetical protein
VIVSVRGSGMGMHMIMGVIVHVVVAMMMFAVGVRIHGAQAADKKHEADSDNREPRYSAEHRINSFRNHVAGKEECGEPEQKHADGVSKRHHSAQQGRVLDGTARTDQICGNDGLAMAGRQRMERAETEGHTQAYDHHPQG